MELFCDQCDLPFEEEELTEYEGDSLCQECLRLNKEEEEE